ncbi:hypothetical protein QFZ44_000156, partial [Pantoea agglomerans]|nr:hypothetical protein [Pantoea agglomerans]
GSLASLPVTTHMRNERLKVIVGHLKRDAAVGNPHLAYVAERLERIRKSDEGK